MIDEERLLRRPSVAGEKWNTTMKWVVCDYWQNDLKVWFCYKPLFELVLAAEFRQISSHEKVS